jgi:MtN3 and saliva related transmembrane protein
MTLTDAIGTAAAALTTLCWLPQVVRAVHGKDTRAISLPAFVVLSTGVACWLIYGVAIGDLPLIGANGISLALVLVILAAKLRYG